MEIPKPGTKRTASDAIEGAMQSALSLRGMMRTHYASDLSAEIRSLVAELNQVVSLLESSDCPPGVAPHLRMLQELVLRFAATHEDNVRYMDDLQYEIVPALKNIKKLAGK
jgi:hypothetical protein